MNNTSAIGTPAFSSPLASQAGVSGSATPSGQFRGEAVVVVKDRSVLGDAAEEIAMHSHFSEKAEESEREEHEVKVPLHLQVMQVNEIKNYLDTAKALDTPGKLNDLAQEIIRKGGRTAGHTAREAFPTNESNQFALLQYALQKSRSDGAPVETQEHILDAIQDLCADERTETRIYAGINSVAEAAAFGRTTGESSAQDIARYQRTYADVVLNGDSLHRTLTLILENFGGRDDRFKNGLGSLMLAVGSDMAAARSSVLEKTYLLAVGKGLSKLFKFNTLHESVGLLLARCGLEARH